MPKGPPPSWNARDCRFDHLVVAAMTHGLGKTLVYNGIESEERAHEIRRGIYRCAKHRNVSAEAGKSVLASGGDMGVHRQPDGSYTLKYRIWDKKTARKRHLERYGSDRQQWPYNPRRGRTAEEAEMYAKRDETGRKVE